MRRVLVIGPGGAGKSTFATRLGEQLQIEVKHLDRYYWQPGWVKPAPDEWLKTVESLVSEESWIIDGNYSGTLDLRLKSCDTIIFLDLNRFVCMWRILKRLFRYRQETRPDMAEGCSEKIDLEFVFWVWNYSRRSRPKVIRLISECAETKQIVWLNSRAEVEKFLTSGSNLKQKEYA
jgi:adenylate kinase family enzyme